MAVRRFKDDLEWSQQFAKAPWWETIYRKAFPAFSSMRYVGQDGWAQRSGIDRLVDLRDGTSIKIDEKVRRESWPDILLELWSDRDRQMPGWAAKDLTMDYLAYAFVPDEQCYLLPFQTLRRALETNRQEWEALAEAKRAGFRFVDSDNGHYVTRSIAIPIKRLLAALEDAMIVSWGTGRIRCRSNGQDTITGDNCGCFPLRLDLEFPE